tara:strand:+ start:891 stop:1118 length:228 start_codon:yes stop_codon:yes gene_type:complete
MIDTFLNLPLPAQILLGIQVVASIVFVVVWCLAVKVSFAFLSETKRYAKELEIQIDTLGEMDEMMDSWNKRIAKL